MKTRIIIAGAGFGGLELASLLSELAPDEVEITLIDKNDAFYFGLSKIDVMFGVRSAEEVRCHYNDISKNAVRFVKDNILSIDPRKRRVITQSSQFDCDFLVIALGADYDMEATPGISGNQFYDLEGALLLKEKIHSFSGGRVVVGVAGAPYKCPPAPSEVALLMHDHLLKNGIRNQSSISLVVPMPVPVPPSPDTSAALLKAFAERGIDFLPNKSVLAYDAAKKLVLLNDGSALDCDLFLGVPKHKVPSVLADSGLVENGWVAVNKTDLRTKFPEVFAIGDVTSVGTPKSGVFAETAAGRVAAAILSTIRDEKDDARYAGNGSCYVEFGEGKVSRIDVDAFSHPSITAVHNEASLALMKDKENFVAVRKSKWFGL